MSLKAPGWIVKYCHGVECEKENRRQLKNGLFSMWQGLIMACAFKLKAALLDFTSSDKEGKWIEKWGERKLRISK